MTLRQWKWTGAVQVLGAAMLVAPLGPAWSQQAEALGTKTEVDVTKGDAGAFVPEGQATPEAVITPPELVTASPAPYPESLASLAEPLGGTVRLELLIGEDGRVGEVTVAESAHPALDEAAVTAAKGLIFTPAKQANLPVAVRIHYSYEFLAPEKPERQPAGMVKGEIRTKGNRRAIANATILLEGKPLGETDADGQFSIELPPGSHALSIVAPGHRDGAFSETVADAQTLEVLYRLEPLVVDPYETIVRGQSERTEVSRITLTEQELREVPGTMGDPFRVVMLMPGVSSIASGISYPVVRGSQPAATGYFVDGVRVPALFHLALGPAVVAPDFIDRIDFIPGAPPARYGRLLGGVVEGYVSRPREDRLHVSAFADLINAGVFVEQPFEKTGTYVTLAGRFSYTGWLAATVAGAMIPSDPGGYGMKPIADLYDYQGRIEQKLGGGRLRLLALGSSDLVGTDSEDPERGIDTLLESRFHRVDLRYQKGFAFGDTEVGVTFGSESVGARIDQGDDPLGRYVLGTTEFSARASWTKELRANLRLSAGADVNHRRARTEMDSEALAAAFGADPSAFRRPLTLATFSGAWAEAQWRPVEPVSVTGGVRADNYHLVPGIDHGAIDPRLAVRWQVRDNLVLKAGGGMVHQPPTVLLTLPVMDIAGLRYGLQEAVTTDVGAEWKPFDGYEVSLDAYYTHYTRALELDLMQVFQEARRRNVLGQDRATWGRSYGMELMIRHPIGQNWFGWISYALQRSERWVEYVEFTPDQQVTGRSEGLLPFAFDQTHVFNAALSYQLPGHWTVGAVLHFNTGRPESGQISSRTARVYTDPESGREVWGDVSRDTVDRLPSFWRVDLRASKRWIHDDFTIEAYLDLLNASFQQEVLGYDYTFHYPNGPTGPDYVPPPLKRPIAIPLVVPMLGVKGVY